jgi:signal transduction histidine kinase
MKLDFNNIKHSISTFSVYLNRNTDFQQSPLDLITAFNNLPISMMIFDAQGHILFYNATCSSLLGLDDLESGERVDRIERIEELPFYLNELKQIIQARILRFPSDLDAPPVERESLKIHFPKGDKESTIGFSIRSESVEGASISSRVWVLIASDISRHKQLDPEEAQRLEELQRSQKFSAITKQITTFALHIFKHLFAISQHTHLLRNQQESLLKRLQDSTPISSEEQQAFALQLEQSQRHLRHLDSSIQNAHNLFKNLEKLNQPILLKLAPVNLNISLRTWVREWEKEGFIPQGVHLQVDSSLEVPKILADSQELKRIIKALVQNSLEATASKETVDIKLYLGLELHNKKDYVAVHVEDNGNGLSEDGKDALLDPFFTTKPNQLLGLGLPYSFKLIEAHKGQFNVDSNLGKGTHITLRFQPLEGLPH